MKALFAGDTDYSHQTLNDIFEDIKDTYGLVIHSINMVDKIIDELKNSGYWSASNIPSIYLDKIEYCNKFFNTTKEELSDILSDGKKEIKEHHCKRLKRISDTASNLNIDLGQMWHKEYGKKDYDNSDFKKTEQIYFEYRQLSVDLLDISNMASRLEDFIGKNTEIIKLSPEFNGVGIDLKGLFKKIMLFFRKKNKN